MPIEMLAACNEHCEQWLHATLHATFHVHFCSYFYFPHLTCKKYICYCVRCSSGECKIKIKWDDALICTLITELIRQLTKKNFAIYTTECVRICVGLNGFDVGVELKIFITDKSQFIPILFSLLGAIF